MKPHKIVLAVLFVALAIMGGSLYRREPPTLPVDFAAFNAEPCQWRR